MSEQLSIFTLANFNLQNFNAALKKEIRGAEISSVDYEQMFPFLMKTDTGEKKKGVCICWLSMGDVIQASAMKMGLSELLLKLDQSFQYSIVILPAVASPALNMFQGSHLRTELYQLRLDLSKKTTGTNIALLDPTPWLIEQGANAVSGPLWYLSKTPFHKNVFISAARACKSTLDAFTGKSKKVLIVDLDDTLWGGIVGDDGLENLKIGGHDAIGEAFTDFQTWIQHIKSWGVVLCICSKNDEKIAMEVFEKHNGMVLKKDDFVKWRINWNDKAANIAEMVKELNVGMDSVVFLDDNPAERDRVRTALPGIFVPDLPDDKMEYPDFIRSLSCFNRMDLTIEDKNRTALYKDEQNRTESQYTFTSVEDWISSLKIEIDFEELNENNLVRAEQLLNKTNQMNLRTRRLSKQELKSWASQKDHWLYVVHVKDAFGDNGITGLLGFHKTGDHEFWIDDFVMSCRIMGRKIEGKMLHFIHEKCRLEKCTGIIAEYIKTDKNQPVFDFFKALEMEGLQFSSTK
jgi:FkbH-like protein